ncbi:unnamed protein product [Trichogramma brassicae]|uniref:Tc1-like transposase DDE domain-containing protein n=1 Tax=Trichogramma brassicae TaxID=86971 RepID=A0A6H5IAA9_9HYME|nr:unnamed protein product [Trichogramma brassicae]
MRAEYRENTTHAWEMKPVAYFEVNALSEVCILKKIQVIDRWAGREIEFASSTARSSQILNWRSVYTGSVTVIPYVQPKRSLGAHRETVRLILRPVMRPYHYIPQPALRDTDPPVRLRFARWVAQMEQENPGWTRTILFSEESNFTQKGTLNRQNYRFWAETNPQWVREVENQRRWTINVWGGIVGDRLVRPHFFDGPLNGEMYIRFLRNDLPRLLRGNPVPRAQMWFHQDGARPHSSRDVTNCLDAEFPGRWIGNTAPGDRKWPPRSPDMTPLDFYLWGRLKDRIALVGAIWNSVTQLLLHFGQRRREREREEELRRLEREREEARIQAQQPKSIEPAESAESEEPLLRKKRPAPHIPTAPIYPPIRMSML